MNSTCRGFLVLGSLFIVAAPAEGCFFFTPFEPLPTNHAPVIDHSRPDLDEPLIIDLPQARAFVLAHDDDEDDLVYTWSIDPLGVLGTSEPLSSGSQVTLDADRDYDGRILEVLVSDRYGGSDSRSWIIDVVWEGR